MDHRPVIGFIDPPHDVSLERLKEEHEMDRVLKLISSNRLGSDWWGRAYRDDGLDDDLWTFVRAVGPPHFFCAVRKQLEWHRHGLDHIPALEGANRYLQRLYPQVVEIYHTKEIERLNRLLDYAMLIPPVEQKTLDLLPNDVLENIVDMIDPVDWRTRHRLRETSRYHHHVLSTKHKQRWTLKYSIYSSYPKGPSFVRDYPDKVISIHAMRDNKILFEGDRSLYLDDQQLFHGNLYLLAADETLVWYCVDDLPSSFVCYDTQSDNIIQTISGISGYHQFRKNAIMFDKLLWIMMRAPDDTVLLWKSDGTHIALDIMIDRHTMYMIATDHTRLYLCVCAPRNNANLLEYYDFIVYAFDPAVDKQPLPVYSAVLSDDFEPNTIIFYNNRLLCAAQRSFLYEFDMSLPDSPPKITRQFGNNGYNVDAKGDFLALNGSIDIGDEHVDLVQPMYRGDRVYSTAVTIMPVPDQPPKGWDLYVCRQTTMEGSRLYKY